MKLFYKSTNEIHLVKYDGNPRCVEIWNAYIITLLFKRNNFLNSGVLIDRNILRTLYYPLAVTCGEMGDKNECLSSMTK